MDNHVKLKLIISWKIQKNANKSLHAKRGLFFNVGLVIAVSLCFIAFEYRVYIDKTDRVDLPIEVEFTLKPENIKVTVQKPKPKPQLPEITKKQDINLVEEKVVESVAEKFDKPEIDLNNIPDLPEGSEPSGEIVDDPIIDVPEVAPSFEGGVDAFYQFVADNLKYPRKEQRIGIEGRIYLQFVIEKDGSITDLKVIRGVSEGLDNEALRVLEIAPNWKPGRVRGQEVRTRMTIPINFQLSN